MSTVPVKCPKCNGDMEIGFIFESEERVVMQQQWHPGLPKDSFWFGTKIDRKKLMKVTTFKCSVCGYLESYA